MTTPIEALREANKIFLWLERRAVYQDDPGIKAAHDKVLSALAAAEKAEPVAPIEVLPPLPEPAYRRLSDLQSGIDDWYSADQMRAFYALGAAEKAGPESNAHGIGPDTDGSLAASTSPPAAQVVAELSDKQISELWRSTPFIPKAGQSQINWFARAIIAAVRTQQAQPQVRAEKAEPPEGWQWGPRGPTPEMEIAGMRALRNTYRTVSGEYSREQAHACWQAMLAATPQAPEEGPPC